ncbi:MAG TPA: helix-turn-helix domain-containing protein, partial [Planctomycetaceae bacterium]|nr:helix-turn-helix domain-containing protein [Planctomycetaceae bacterium]
SFAPHPRSLSVMSKKYLSIEEAAAQIGISTAELNRLREKGTIRAFADRGTWKFKEEEVEKLARSRQADSSPDVPLQTFDTPAEGSAADLLFSDDDAMGSEPTIIRTGRDDDSGSDSDVRLIFDDTLNVPEAKGGAAPEDSDSDVKLAGAAPASKDAGSDSDVKLVTDVEPTEPTGSDSDVRLVSSDSSGDVKIAKSRSGIQPGSAGKEEGSAIELAPAGEGSSVISKEGSSVISEGTGEGSSVIESESGISLAEHSGITLASDSGISLEQPNDSGISLAEEGSTVLSSESGISLAGDSGISLSEDSGISLSAEAPVVKGAPKKGKGRDKDRKAEKGPESDDLTGTIPLMDVPLADSEDILDTQMEVPMLGDSSDEASVIGGSRSDATNVITLDDEEDDGDYAVTSVKKKGADLTDDELFATDEVAVEDADEALEVADEIIGEDDELAEDVFGAEDEDFGDVESGVSSADLPIGGPRVTASAEQEWGAPTFALLVISAVLLLACGTVMFDLVRNMWHTDVANQNPVASMLLDTFKGL